MMRPLRTADPFRGTGGEERSAKRIETLEKQAASSEKYSAPALSKGLDILELLATQPAGLKKTEIAAELGRTVNELYRMLAVLESRGFVMMGRQ